jgi:predicted small lipoprotein YifL
MPRALTFIRITPFVLAALLLAACGNKGPLVKPTEAPAPVSDAAH